MRAVTAVLGLGLLATTGCSGLMTTRVSYPDPTIDATCDKAPGWTTVAGALGCAAFVRNDLDRRAGLQAAVPRYLGAALIPLTAAIAGLAMTGTTGAPITALTLGGVAAMGEGIWLSSPERRQTYGIGASAVQCVITTARPLAFRDGPGFPTFEASAFALPSRILDVSVAINRVEAALAAAPAVSADERAEILAEIGDAALAITTARQLVQTAVALVNRLNGASEEIHGSVDRIIRLVNEEIDKLEPTMDKVRLAITQQNELRTAAFAGLDALIKDSVEREKRIAASAKARSQAGAQSFASVLTRLEPARKDLLAALNALNVAMVPVAEGIARVGNPPPAQGCVSTAEGLVGAGVLTITRASEDPVLPGQSVAFIVTGGVGEVLIRADADSQAALDVTQNAVGLLRQVVVKVKPETRPGTYLVDVLDRVNKQVVKIAVRTPPPAPLKVTGADDDRVKRAAPGTAPKALQYSVTGGSGDCKAKLSPPDGFAEPQTIVVGSTCVVTLAWAPTPKTGTYTLTVTFGDATGTRKFSVE